jgi:hypothetical protein
MVDEEGSTIEDILAQISSRGKKRLAEEFNRVRYHVFARPFNSDRWMYIAAIRAKSDAVAVTTGLIEGRFAAECVISVVASSPGPRAGRLIIVNHESGP